MSKTVIELQNIKRNFRVGDETVHALRGVSFSIGEGEFVTIMGTSGKIDTVEHTRLSGHAYRRRVPAGRHLRAHHEQVTACRTPQP